MLSEIWETYAHLLKRVPGRDAISNAQRKQELLDRFLCLFVQQTQIRQECLVSSEMRNVANELSQEFMRNIMDLPSSESEDENPLDLERYLLDGRGWMLLYAIHIIGVKRVYNRQDLCNILQNLLLSCLKLCPRPESDHLSDLFEDSGEAPVNKCFEAAEYVPKHKVLGIQKNSIPRMKPTRIRQGEGKKKHYTKTLYSHEKATGGSASEGDDSDDRKSRHRRFRKSMRTQMWTSSVKEEVSDSDEDFVNMFQHLPTRIGTLSSSSMFRLILLLLEDLGTQDVRTGTPGKILSLTILPVLIDVLKSFSEDTRAQMNTEQKQAADHEVISLPWQRETCLLVLQHLLRLILTLSAIVATQQTSIRILLSQNVFPAILRSLTYCHVIRGDKSTELSSRELSIVEDGINGCLALFKRIYAYLPFNPSFIRDANALMELFRIHNGEEYFMFLFSERDKSLLVNKSTKKDMHAGPIRWLSDLIHGLKVVKVNYIHAIKCLKRRHRNCDYSFFFHHHHDIFGAPFETWQALTDTSQGEEPSRPSFPSLCQMAKWSHLLLECLKRAKSKTSIIQILCTLQEEGTCCCLQPSSIISLFVSLIPSFTPAVRNFALETQNLVLLEQFHGCIETNFFPRKENLMCPHCCMDRDLLDGIPVGIDSGVSSGDLAEVHKQKSLLRWRSLRLLRQHILSGTESVALSVAKSLITLAIRGNSDIKEELFFGIYLHVLNMEVGNNPVDCLSLDKDDILTPTSTDISSGEEVPFAVTVPSSIMLYCVSSLPYVLQVDKVMNLFLNKGGLTCLTRLLDNDQLRGPIMGVFEALIMLDEHTVITKSDPKGPASPAHHLDYNGGTVIQTFIDTLAKKTCVITAALQQLQIQSLQSMPAETDTMEEGSDVEDTVLQQEETNHLVHEQETVTDLPMLAHSGDVETQQADAVDRTHRLILATLPLLQDMWRTCAKLCMNSQTFRTCYQNSPCLYIVQETLVLALTIMSDMGVRPCNLQRISATAVASSCEGVDSGRNLRSFICHLSKLGFIEAVMIVCFSCGTINPLQKQGEEEEMWLRMKHMLLQCVNLEPGKLRAVFDMLLNAAQPQLPSILEYSYAQITSFLNQKDMEELEDEDELRKLMSHATDEELDTLHTGQGYDADTESDQGAGWQTGLESTVTGTGNSREAERRCFPAVLRLFVELLVESQNTSTGQSVLVPVMLRLLQMLRSCHDTVTAACKQGLMGLILEGFKDVLLQSSGQHQSVVREIAWTLIQVIGQVEIASSELQLFLKLFLKTKNMSSLLSSLTHIVENSRPAPPACLVFPTKAKEAASFFKWKAPPHVDEDSAPDPPLTGSLVAAAHCEVKGLQWPPFEKGFAVSFWVSLGQLCGMQSADISLSSFSESQRSDVKDERELVLQMPSLEECLHLISLGTDSKCLEVWLHVKSAALVCRLTSGTVGNIVLKEMALGTGFEPLSWHHVVLAYRDELDGSTSLGKLYITVDGVMQKEIFLDHPASSWHARGPIAPPVLFWGHSTSRHIIGFQGRYRLGAVLLFTDSTLSKEWWFHLYALGPNTVGIGLCDCGSARVSYTSLLQKNLLMGSSLNQDVLVGTMTVPDIENARMALVLHFDPNSPEYVGHYGQGEARESGSLLGLVPASAAVDPLLLHRPHRQPVSGAAHLKVQKITTLPGALEQLGGLQAMLFLVAKVFEQCDKTGQDNKITSQQMQSKAVHLLLTFIRRFPPLAMAFTSMQGYDMLGVVLKSSRAIVGYPLIKVLFDAATSEPLFRVDLTSLVLIPRTSSESIIRHVAVISKLLLCWKIWEQGSQEMMEMILGGLVILTRRDHPHRTFNVKQLLADSVLRVLFNIYLERIQDGLPALSATCGQSVAAIVASLVGQPPDMSLLASVTDFLLQVHPASSGFIDHSPSAFYISRTWEFDHPTATTAAESMVSDSFKRGADSRQQSLSDLGSNMEKVQFHSGSKFSVGNNWDSNEGTEDSDNGSEVRQTAQAQSPYPPLEATAATPSTFCVGESSDDSTSSPRHSSSSESSGERSEQSLKKLKGKLANQYSRSAPAASSYHMRGAMGDDKQQIKKALHHKETDDSAEEYGHLTSHAEHDQSPDDSSKPVNFEKSEDVKMDGLETLKVYLLQYLHKVVMEHPQQDFDDVFCHVVSPKILLFLARSTSEAVRIAVTQVLGVYLWRAPTRVLEDFLKVDGFFLLANQLSAFPVCQQQMEAAVSMILTQTFTFQNFLVHDIGQLSLLQQMAPILMLSLLSRTVADFMLCHNSLSLIAQLLQGTQVISTALLDVGLADALCNLLYEVHCHYSSRTDTKSMESKDVLLVDIQTIFCSAAVSEFSWSGITHIQQMDYMFQLLQTLEDKQKARGEGGQKLAETARAFQFAMVVKVLEYSQHLSQEFSKTPGGWASAQNISALQLSTSSESSASSQMSSQAHQPAASSQLSQQLGPGNLSAPRQGQTDSRLLRNVYSSPDIVSNLFGTDQEDSSSVSSLPTLVREGRSGKPLSYSRSQSSVEKPTLLRRLFKRRKKLEYIRIGQSELLDRLKKFLVMAVDLAVFQDRQEVQKSKTQHTLSFLAEPKTSSLDDRYLKHLFSTVYNMLSLTLCKDSFQRKWKATIMSSMKDVLRVQFGRLLLCMLSPWVEFELRIFAVSFLMGESLGRNVVCLLASTQGIEMGLHLHNLLTTWRDWMNPGQRELTLGMLSQLRQCGCPVISLDQQIHSEQAEALNEDKMAISSKFTRDQLAWLNRRRSNSKKVLLRFDDVVKRVSEHAMDVTRAVSGQQGRERAALIDHIKNSMAQQVHFMKSWQDLVHSLTHERGVWHHSQSYPKSWQLDPTEGPGRIRRRLMRCHLGLAPKYLLPEHRSKLVGQEEDPPLKYLFEDTHQVSDSATLVYKLFTNDTVQYTVVCTAVSPSFESKGEFLLGEQFLFFVADKAITHPDYTQILLGNQDQLSMTWRYTELLEVHSRWYQLQDTALEIFLVTGRTYLLSFDTMADRDKVLGLLLSQLEKPKGQEQTVGDIQKMWLEGNMTNFDYLTCLNKLSGRSFNDLMQYPILPFILRDYESDELNLEDPSVFRDLRKPIAVQDKSRERKYIDNYEFLRQEMLRPGPEEVMHVEPFHYGSHYSNSGTVLHYLVRLPPFTQMFLAYQDKSFDIPDRTFHSIRTSWRLSSFESSTDVKELIPEFFFLPEFLVNNEGFDFGVRQNGEQVNDVLLPPWSGNDARIFVLIHRQALESPIATQMLNHWIDLVFGFKQKGEEAIKAINVFHPSTYFGVDVSSVTDQVKRQALLTMIRTYGQTPRQLFFTPHSGKSHLSSSGLKFSISQQERRTYVPRPVPTVNGLKWGNYVGSPDLPQPSWHLLAKLEVEIASLVSLGSGSVFGIERDSTLISLQAKPTDPVQRQADIMLAGTISWNHPDNILRVLTHNNRSLLNFMATSPYERVTCCAAALDRCLLFVATASGSIGVYNISHNVAKPTTLHVWGLQRVMCGHGADVNVIQISKAFGVVVSGSRDASVIIWDLNRLSYVRTLSSHKHPIVALAVSPTLGDVASASHTEKGSTLWVHTINGCEVGHYSCVARIQCLAYSCAPEGRSINVIAGGLDTGVIRLWSSWDLSHLRDLVYDEAIKRPVLSLAFSANSQALFVAATDHSIVLWQNDPPTSQTQSSHLVLLVRNLKDRQ
ncbi:lysosomal-trafficking regulator-like isoform X3 [Pomacea canaliculata]|uniref:lysosomal-trafficking regulator-like isoform X3 n=1 Tax=Pomacea canaliculata TaxID=400727 RepID=UPI000D73B5A9|nr:lysosomal-trafficking regulator-like isoform X3 [Pomacea canaliculata]